MLKLLNMFGAALLLFALLTSCEMHSSDNGDLDNWWYLRQIDDLTADTQEDVVAKKVFWGYIGNMMHTEGGGAGRFFFRFEHSGNTLRIYDARYDAKKSGDPLLDPTVSDDKDKIDNDLPKQGIHLRQNSDGKLEETFTVEHIDGETMTLVNEDNTYRLHFEAWQ